MDGKGIGDAIISAFIGIAVIAFGLGGLLMWVIPELWNLLKPIIHAATS